MVSMTCALRSIFFGKKSTGIFSRHEIHRSPLAHGQPAFPSDPKLSVVPHGTVATTKYNISQIVMGSHQGTHLDAMYHFSGRTLDQMPLDWFYGPAHVLRIPKRAGDDITVEDFLPFEYLLQPEAKIIFATGWATKFGTQNFFENFPSLTQKAIHTYTTNWCQAAF